MSLLSLKSGKGIKMVGKGFGLLLIVLRNFPLKTEIDDMKQKKPVLIIPIETKVREFVGKLFLAYTAAKAGYKVIFGDQSTIQNITDLLPRGFYLSKSVAATTKAQYTQLKKQGFTPVAWDEEGLLYFSTDVYHKLRLSKESLHSVEAFFCWGKEQCDDIRAFCPDVENKLFLCGNPRFDLLRKELLPFHTPKVSEYSEEYGKIILLNTNFGFYNHYRSPEEVRNMLANFPLSSEAGFIDGWIDFQHAGFDAFRDILPLLSKKFPDYSIVLRPHPSENHKKWEDICGKFENVSMRADGNVHEWIIASEVIVHFNCTTAVEAFILGVAPITYRPIQQEKYENTLPKIVSYDAFTPDEVIDSISRALAKELGFFNEVWSEDAWKVVNRYVTGLEGSFASERVVSNLKNVSLSQESISCTVDLLRRLKLNWRKILYRYREMVSPSDGYCLQKQPGFSAIEIEEVLTGFNAVNGLESNFSVKQCFKNVYEIELSVGMNYRQEES